MKASVYILFGAAFTFSTALALGTMLLRILAIRLHQLEERLIGFVCGSALLSGIVFFLCTVKLARKGIFFAVGAAIILFALRFGVYRRSGDPLPPLPRAWTRLLVVIFAAYTVLYFFNAMAPEMSPDGTAYHMAFPADYYRAHGFAKITTNIYANITQGIELLFLFAYAFGRHSSGALVHFSFLLTLPLLMICYGRRFGLPLAGAAAAAFVFVSPVVGIDGASAYVDVALATVLFALFYLLQIWDAQRDVKLLIPIAVLAGFAFAVKYTAVLALPYALGYVAWKLWRERRPFLRPVAAMAAIALVFVMPWLIKNWMWVDNPVSPFANRVFPNRFVHVSFEDEYRLYQRIYTITSYRQIPWETTVSGYRLCGMFGPLYLLTPLALLALRWRAGRRLLLAALIFGIPYATNIGTRFLIPAAPFLSLALAMVLVPLRLVLPAIVLAHAIASWPQVLSLYSSEFCWRLVTVPVRQALRLEPEGSYLSRKFPGYMVDRMLEEHVPPGQPVFSFSQTAESYTSRQILVKYQAAPNEILADILLTPLYQDYQPTRTQDFHFAPRRLRKLRLVQTADTKEALWSVSEFRVYNHGAELPRAPQWRLRARPNPWDVQMAFDNSPVTRWRTWERAKPGMFLEIDFGVDQSVDEARVETSNDWRDPRVKIEGLDNSGRWVTLSDHCSETDGPLSVSLRHAATEELKARGVRFLLIGYDDLGSEDFQQHAKLWGLQLLGDQGFMRLYYIN
jgi:hypothetical protein